MSTNSRSSSPRFACAALLLTALPACSSPSARLQQGSTGGSASVDPASRALTLPDGGTATCPSTGTPVERWGQLRVIGTDLVSQCGEAVQLKGTSSMWLNWDDARYAVRRDGMEYMRDNWNMTVFRIAMGITPAGAYLADKENTLNDVRTIIDNAIELGVYVIVDWHDHEAETHLADSQEFFATIAREYGDTPNVLYETYNEPIDAAWATVLKPYHQAVVNTIRAVDPDNIVILGTPMYSQDVDAAASDLLAGDNLMYTLHFYACSHGGSLRSKADAARIRGAAVFVTEWGATPADGGAEDRRVCTTDAQSWHDWMNEKKISWTAWKLDGCADTSCFFPDRSTDWEDGVLNGHTEFVVERMRD